MNSSNAKIIAVIIIIAVLGYFLYQKFGADDNATLTTTTDATNTAAVGADILILLNQINALQIDSQLFTDPAYQSLTDFTNAVPTLPQGKKNPFAPFVISAPAKTATKAR